MILTHFDIVFHFVNQVYRPCLLLIYIQQKVLNIDLNPFENHL